MTRTAQDEPLAEQRVREILEQRWGIEAATLQPLGGELDASLRVVDTDGRAYCLKMRRLVHDDGSVSLEIDTLGHVSTQGNVAVPTIVDTAAGETSIEIDGFVLWVLDWIPGRRWVDVERPTPTLQRALGATARRLAASLDDFTHQASQRTHHWDLRTLDASIKRHLDQCEDDEQQRIARQALKLFEKRVAPVLPGLAHSVVHQDLNDHNIIVGDVDDSLAVIDFGDVLHSATITELAVAIAYAMLRSEHPVDAAANVAAGWFGDTRPTDDELAVLFPLAVGRLLVNALTWSARRAAQPDYAQARSSHTWDTLRLLGTIPTAFVDARILAECGAPLPALVPEVRPGRSAVAELPVADLDPRSDALDGVDVANSSELWGAAVPNEPFFLPHDSVRADLGGYADGKGGPATIQLGVEIHQATGIPVSSSVGGVIVEAGMGRIIVHHQRPSSWWSVWSGLNSEVSVGDTIQDGGVLGAQADAPTRVQLLTFAPAASDDIPSHVRPLDRAAWTSVSVDPSVVVGLQPVEPAAYASDDGVKALRNSRLASSQRYYYDDPMHLVRASGVTFVDAHAHHYLDVINNVTHVGHGNQRVVDAVTKQMTRLNTNSRFVYEQMGAYADRLVQRLPDRLEVVFLVCTGSEANDLAVRIARQVTGRTNMMVVAGAYHGNTGVVTGISPNRYRGAGGDGPPPTTFEVAQPNQYRGPFGYDEPDSGERYADDVRSVSQRLVDSGEPPAAFIAESLMGTAGQVVYPDGYLASAFAHVRSAGGLCISDEVQVGFGRLGDAFWGFERGGVVPDIVTMGKPMGNGHPIAAVVTTREIADAFDKGMKYFNTFGGNPVSCAAASAVLDEIDSKNLQVHAHEVGEYFLSRLRSLMLVHDCIGDVRGIGLYLGVEFVLDRETKAPAKNLTARVCERLRELGVVMYPNGDLGNCLKIKPPMVFSRAEVNRFVGALHQVLDELD